jgi:hypothetical protein
MVEAELSYFDHEAVHSVESRLLKLVDEDCGYRMVLRNDAY